MRVKLATAFGKAAVEADSPQGRCEIRLAERQLWIDGRPVQVGSRAFDLLVALETRRDRVVSKAELLKLVWPGAVVEENNLQVQVFALRKLLGPDAITTVPGQGYRYTRASLPRASGTVPTAAATPVAAPAHAATPWPTLYGREAALQALAQWLLSHRLVSVVGAGGVGKTALVQTLAPSLHTHFEGGVYIIDLAPLTDASPLVPTVASALQLTLGAGPAVQALVGQLAQRRLLLVLDNCEHLLQPVADLVQALLRGAPGLVLLTTSQEALKLRDEQVYRLGTLALPAALCLFEARARAADPSFTLTPDNTPVVADICQQLDGMALAIELAAARLPLLGLEGLRQRLGERLRLLSSNDRDRPSRHRTVRAALEWSHALLNAQQQTVFRRLGVMSGSFGVDSAQHVATAAGIDPWDALDALGALVDKSLITTEHAPGAEPRFRMLETMRQHALQLLGVHGETEAVRERHLAFFLALAEAARAPLNGPQQGEWLARLDLDRDNFFAAHRACDSAAQGAARGMRLVTALSRYWLSRGLMAQGQRVIEEAAARPGAELHGALRAEAWLRAGWLYAYRGLDREAAALLAQSAALARRHGAASVLAEALSCQGYAHISLGDRTTARACIEEAYALVSDKVTRRVTSNHLAELERLEGHLDRAAQLYEETQQIARAAGDRLAQMIGLNNLAMVAVATGRTEAARGHLLASLDISDELGSRRGRLVVMEVCAALASRLQQWPLCARFDAAADVHTVQMGRRRDVVDAEFLAPWLAAARQHLGEAAHAQAHAAGRTLGHDAAVAEMRAWLASAGPGSAHTLG